VFLRREGHGMSRHRAHRLWRLASLQAPRRRPRRRVAASRPRPMPAFGPNHVWAYDFVFDASASGQQIKCLTVIDEFTRECLAIDVAGSIRSGRVIEVLARLISQHGASRFLRSDNGPESVSHAILEWLGKAKIDTALNDPGKPWQNGADESFNGKFRDECLSLEWFRSREEARVVIETWRRHYNHVRPHRASRTSHRSNSRRVTIPPTPGPSSSSKWSEDPWAGHTTRLAVVIIERAVSASLTTFFGVVVAPSLPGVRYEFGS
jgi:putative transposase